MDTSLTHLVQQGGVMMIPLLGASTLALAVVIERFAFFLGLQAGNAAFRARLYGLVREGKREEARRWLRDLRGPVPATAAAALEKWDLGYGSVETAMASAARKEKPPLDRFMPILDTTVTAAPLVGLLGTIMGMMGVFRVVAQKLAHNPAADTTGITAGIGEALVATATGIMIAVVCLIFNNFFQAWADRHLDATEQVAGELLSIHEESGK